MLILLLMIINKNCFVLVIRFKGSSGLKEHLEAKHTKGGVKCDICDDRVPWKYRLPFHKARLHTAPYSVSCKICGKSFESDLKLKDHMRSNHQEDKKDSSKDKTIKAPTLLNCDQCPKTFGFRSALSRHKTECHGRKEKGFMCDTCGKVTMRKEVFEIHKKRHLGIKEAICHVCGKGYVNSRELKTHLIIHSREQPYDCHICQKSFTYHTTLKKHLRVHKNDGTWKENPDETKKC